MRLHLFGTLNTSVKNSICHRTRAQSFNSGVRPKLENQSSAFAIRVKPYLRLKRQGRPKGGALKAWQSAQIAKSVIDKTPDELKFPFYL
jgi:hypothetical protein